ncbi:hypothetical protein F0L68_26370 [Solihabitans fulvus]|uniref:ATP-grasp domain-containing protein n=1 Tax=Solihabitans fulvus TaxID=1892852 RepID=A0A5B2X092_9PSEU|nr:STM4014 family protein [Solihabitans fulvus]KAA2256316.1 hypothetical protein F0L68_26370 [Solihabitans fulvus]
MTVRFAVVGNPENRRVVLFRRAAARVGLPEPRVLPWLDVLTGSAAVPADCLVRLDSPGENAAVDRLLRGPDADPHRVEGGAAWHRAFTSAVAGLAGAVARTPGARLLGDPAELAAMFDKRRSHAILAAAGVPLPPALAGVTGYATLRERMAEAGWTRVFVKPAHGSSAAGVIALSAAGARVAATTSAALRRDDRGMRLHNSLRVRRYTDPAEVAALVDTVCADGVQVERWLPKASLHGSTIDLRVVVVAGRATHAVVRASRHPMTNLHLGGARGDLAALRRATGEPAWERALDTCVRAAGAFPRSLSVGVDLMFRLGWRGHAVAEVNAFGDLLPGLTGLPGSGAEERDTYDEQVHAVLSGRYKGIPCLT